MCCTWLAGNRGRKNDAKNRHLCTIARICRAVSLQLRHYRQSEQMSETAICPPHVRTIWRTYGPLTPETVGEFGAPQQISTGFASCLHYCSNVAYQRPTKLCTMFGRLLVCYTIYTFSGAIAPWQNFARCNVHFTSKSCVLLYWQHYCTALQQRASAKLCGVVQGMELRNFHRGATYIRQGGHHVGHRPTF